MSTLFNRKKNPGVAFFNNKDSFNTAIKNYCTAVLVILKGLNKHLPAYEDYSLVQSYFSDSFTQAQEDLKEFKTFCLDAQASDTVNTTF